MGKINGLGIALAASAAAMGLAALALGGLPPRLQNQTEDAPLVKKIAVPADSGWVDTGMDVGPGEQIVFQASGQIDLQRGNPEAVCGPEGLDLVTVGQPIPNANLGALIGKVVQLVAKRTDEDSGMEVRDEIFVLFLIGPESAVMLPIKGRLYLGVNENVLKDNAGEYSVLVFRRPA